MKNTNSTLLEQFQNPVEKSQANSILLTHKYTTIYFTGLIQTIQKTSGWNKLVYVAKSPFLVIWCNLRIRPRFPTFIISMVFFTFLHKSDTLYHALVIKTFPLPKFFYIKATQVISFCLFFFIYIILVFFLIPWIKCRWRRFFFYFTQIPF